MRLDNFSNVVSQDQLADTPPRLSIDFVNGGVSLSLATYDLTSPLQNGNYIEVVYLLHQLVC